MASGEKRVIAHLDLDVQVEQKLNPELRGKPVVVVQYNAYKGGSIIAVGYEARKEGVKRGTSSEQAKLVCPALCVARVPEAHGKANLTRYREAGAEVVKVIMRLAGVCERASIDEMYIDVSQLAETRLATATDDELAAGTRLTHIVGQRNVLGETQASEGAATDASVQDALQLHTGSQPLAEEAVDSVAWIVTRADRLLAAGALVVADIRAAVLRECGYTVSAGIAHNRMLAKLTSGMNKPYAQTLIPMSRVPAFFAKLPLSKIRGLGGKFGVQLQQDMGIEFVGQLAAATPASLMRHYDEKTVAWLRRLSQGLDDSPVEMRSLAKSIGCSKTFPGPNALKTFAEIDHWLGALAIELGERLDADQEANQRTAKTLTLNYSTSANVHSARSCPLRYSTSNILQDASLLIRKFLAEPLSVTILGLNASVFSSDSGTHNNVSITRFLGVMAAASESASPMKAAPLALPSNSEASASKIPSWARLKNATDPPQAQHHVESESSSDDHDGNDDEIPDWVLKDMAMQNEADVHIVLDDDDDEKDEAEQQVDCKKTVARTSSLTAFFKPAPAGTTCHECFAVFDDERDLQEHLDHHVAMRLLEEEQHLRLAQTTTTTTPSTLSRKRKHATPARAASPPPPPPKRGGLMQWLSRS